ncbi:MAG: TetM/TetW/TetO/TetS family tetracycline resistance ribosomal protection protein [Lachnospiraceae bacterium]|nr:TetM/TetW/TetO/TetS family tetracycline resistance ribosomal protection protein [Lachnospiraceae bacterium]
MEKASENKPIENKKHLCIGILAHVDAGKTTLAEGILYLTGSIRKLGRVDHQDAFLDNFELERARGITIFSKQAELMLGDLPVTLLDTPGHVDFSAEMERTLQILDYAVLVISGADGVQGHVETLWRLLERYQIPVFLFVNKMDQQGTDRAMLLQELTKRLDHRCIDFGPLAERDRKQNGGALPEGWKDFQENLAMCDESVLERYLEEGDISDEDIAELIAERKVFPCYFGSALKIQGVEELLAGIRSYGRAPDYPEKFGARVYKITRDSQGNRLTHMKITGGTLRVKELLTNRREPGEDTAAGAGGSGAEIWEQKADQIRIYSGSGFQPAAEAGAGVVCAVTGLEYTYAGEGLGAETEAELPLLEPVLSYRIELPPECDVHKTFLQLRQLEEEEPELHIVWDEQLGEIHAQLMGEVQIEVLKNIIRQRFGIWVEFGSGSIVYKETIEAPVEGMGHFEPLRHYAEVHLLLEPAERGSGLQFASDCSEDVLSRNWQRLILTHLEEKQHRGVLTGSEITDMRITLIAGRAHQKHTEGGDFRQATYRAVRHGLKRAKSILLEPVYEFSLEVPAESVGRAMADIQKMYGSFEPPVIEGETAVLKGQAPVVTMRGYQTELAAYTKGRGRLLCTLKGYEECHNAEEVIAERGYDSEADLDNPTGSVFCAHGAGFVVSWDKVQEYMHVESGWSTENEAAPEVPEETGSGRAYASPGGPAVDEKELEEIFARTYGAVPRKRNHYTKSRRVESPGGSRRPAAREAADEYLLVDGYNIIFAWDDLKELAKTNIDAARDKLMDVMCNYQGYKKNHLILVFDAYKVTGGRGEVFQYHNIHVVYTKEAETADQYIEKTVREIDKKYHVTVATSDALEQIIILGAGAARMSAAGLLEEVELMKQDIRANYLEKQTGGKNYLFDHLDDSMNDFMEDVRLGRRTLEE